MITIFTIPKSFEGRIAVAQRNSLGSWVRLGSDCEIVLCGDDAGIREAAEEFGVRHIGGLRCTPFGTPLLSSAFELVQATARHRLICYVNADIMILSDLVGTMRRVTFEKFLVAGRRWDLDVTEPIDFRSPLAGIRLHIKKRLHGKLARPVGSDYFIFPTNLFNPIPDFAVGRAGWDNWLMHHAHELGFPLIDATAAVTAIHQNHDYAHVPGRRGNTYRGPESDQNLTLMSDTSKSFDLTNFTWQLTPQSLMRNPRAAR